MKKRVVLIIAMILGFTGIILAQDVEVPSNWQDLYDNYGKYLATYLGMAGVGSFFAELLIRWRQIGKKWVKVALLVVTTLAVAFLVSLVLNIGYLKDAPWWQVALEGGLAAAAAAGLRSTNLLFVKSIIDFLVGLLKARKEPKADT